MSIANQTTALNVRKSQIWRYSSQTDIKQRRQISSHLEMMNTNVDSRNYCISMYETRKLNKCIHKKQEDVLYNNNKWSQENNLSIMMLILLTNNGNILMVKAPYILQWLCQKPMLFIIIIYNSSQGWLLLLAFYELSELSLCCLMTPSLSKDISGSRMTILFSINTYSKRHKYRALL